MSYKTYGKYKDSELTWLGNIPYDWELEKLAYHSTIITGHPFNSDLFSTDGIPLIRIRDLKEEHTSIFWNNDYPDYAIINNGDLLVGMDGDFDVVTWKGNKALLNQRIFKIDAKNKLLDDYLKYMLQIPITHINELTMSTTVKHLSVKDVNDILIPLPSNDEQKQIANYLDKKTTAIDMAIEKNKELIELLEEKRIAFINKKINDINYDSVKLKDVLKVGGYIRGPFGSSLKRDELKYSGIPVYEQQHAIYDSRDFRYFIDEDKFKELIRFKTVPNDLIISCSGTVGEISIISDDDPIGIISQALLILRINEDIILPDFLKYFLSSHKGHEFLVSESNGAAQVNISQKDVINKIPVKLPPLDIQRDIINDLEKIDYTINKTINQVNKNINLLDEYKTSLIHNVVTGKIDVRGDET